MTGDVGCEVLRTAGQKGELLELTVVIAHSAAVLAIGLHGTGPGLDDGKHVVATGNGIATDDFTHSALKLDADATAGLVTAVDEVSVMNLRLGEIGHIDKGHAACQETEDEHIAHQTERGTRKGECLKPLNDVLTYPALDGALYSGIDLAEGMGLLGQALRHAAIVYGTEGTQVTGDGIEAYAAALEPVFIIGQQGGGDGTEGKVAHGTESAKGTKGGGIIARGAVTAGGCHAVDFGRHVMEKGGTALAHGTGRGSGLTG